MASKRVKTIDGVDDELPGDAALIDALVIPTTRTLQGATDDLLNAPTDMLWMAQRLDRIIRLLDERNALDRTMAETMLLMTGGGQPIGDRPARPAGDFVDYREVAGGQVGEWEVMVGVDWYPATPGDVMDIERRNSARRTRRRR